MPIPVEIREELQRQRFAEHRTAERDTWWDYARTALACFAWCMLGIALMAWSVHTTDESYGRVAFWAGLGIGNAGIMISILGLYRRGEARGDW